MADRSEVASPDGRGVDTVAAGAPATAWHARTKERFSEPRRAVRRLERGTSLQEHVVAASLIEERTLVAVRSVQRSPP